MIGARYEVRTAGGLMHPFRRSGFRKYDDACDAADRIGGHVIELAGSDEHGDLRVGRGVYELRAEQRYGADAWAELGGWTPHSQATPSPSPSILGW